MLIAAGTWHRHVSRLDGLVAARNHSRALPVRGTFLGEVEAGLGDATLQSGSGNFFVRFASAAAHLI